MMASAGEDAVAGAEAGNSTKKNRRRISDYLADDSDGGEASPPSPSETPPQLLRLPRFTCARFRFVRLGRKRDGRKEVIGANKKAEDASLDSSAGSKPAETSTSGGNAAAETGGMGLSMLLLLLARTCVELNRMAEVRAQMETLLKEIRDEASKMKASAHHNHHVAVKLTRTFSLQLSSSSSSCTSDTDTNHHHATTSSSAEEAILPPQGCESKPADDGERAGLVQLEAAEFEAEPAQHRPTIECNAEQESSVYSSDDDEFIELDGGCLGGDRKWDAGDEEESEEDSTAGAQAGGAVSAVELERRLHELLHRRNRERIEELESALRRAELKAREKEVEARLWQDTATLALQPPSLTRDGQ